MLYELGTQDVYDHMRESLDNYDFSNYSREHPNYSIDNNNKRIEKFKDELKSLPLEEFISLKPKCYSLFLDKDKEKQTAKGGKSAVKKHTFVTVTIATLII